MSKPIAHFYDFGPFRVDTLKRLLLRDGRSVPLTSKVFDTLLALVSRGGEVLEKNELMRVLWPDTIVEENNLTQNISVLRKALGESRHEHRYIVTIPGRGYSFVAAVREACEDEETGHEERGSGVPAMEAGRSVAAVASTGDYVRAHDSGRNGHAAIFKPSSPPERWKPFRDVARPGSASSPRRRVLALSLLLLFTVTTLSYLWIISRARSPLRPAAPGSIAVLPFKLLGDEARDEYLGSGMADALITKLSNIRQISVRPTSAVIRYAGRQSTDPLAAGRELGVDSVLEGTIQRAGDRVRVTVQLISVRESRALWAHSFDERFTDIFTVQDSISAQVAQALTLKLTGEEQRLLAKRYTDNVEAYQSYLRGRYFMNRRNEEGLLKAISCFTEAIELEPGYALAYAGLADAYSVLGFYQFGARAPEEVFQKARAAATRAIELDETLAEAHASLALARLDVDEDEAGAEREYLRSIELNPNYAPAHHWYSDFLAMMDRQDEAMAEIKRALELDPLSLVINATLGERLFYARRYDDAAAQLRKTLEMEESFSPAHYLLGLTYEQKGMYTEALAELNRARELSGGSPWMVAALGHTLAMAGRRDEAHKVLVELKELARRRPVSPYDMATVYTGLGEKTQAFEWLQKSYKPQLRRQLRADPRMDRLRLDPRFQEIYSS
ncbi:MAG TPA: tetratricopeptide repeat protein [Pyrinomonadaceae bacterium]|jgi:TolB-like protein/DNA-binding winged helix-turn-helix (wHTH) protein/Flp pilus assembly protein TadD|nr:tetratricopeptide repeat protein [Pyrinomonadaceae bacterium]